MHVIGAAGTGVMKISIDGRLVAQAKSLPPRDVVEALSKPPELRVPVEDGSLTDLTAVLGRDVTAAEINAAFEQAAAGPMAGILHYSTDPLVSRDIIGDPASCVFDSGLTQAAGSLAKVFGWYDNEWGYTCRLADLTAIVGEQL